MDHGDVAISTPKVLNSPNIFDRLIPCLAIATPLDSRLPLAAICSAPSRGCLKGWGASFTLRFAIGVYLDHVSEGFEPHTLK